MSKARNPQEVKLLLNVHIQDTGKEKWTAAGGFFMSPGSAAEVAAAIRSFQADVRPVQEQLALDYRGTFYKS